MERSEPHPGGQPDLGWKAQKMPGGYAAGLPLLSDDEEALLCSLARRYSEHARANDVSDYSRAKEAVELLLPRLLNDEGLEADADQIRYLSSAALAHLAGFAPLDKMLADEQVEEVAVIGLHKPVYVYVRKKGWQASDVSFTRLEHLTHTINKMARPLGRRVTGQSPRLNALLPDGSRLHASIPPLSPGELTIRRFGARPWTVADLMMARTTSAQALAFLWLGFQSDSSVLIAGNTSSGKTTLLSALFSFVPLSERVVVIEETPELRLAHPHVVPLVSNDELSIRMADLVRDSLRMRPDRVIAGEVRLADEVEGFVETLLSGQARGSYATFHAQSGAEALRRLSNLGARPDDLASLDFVVLQRRIARYNARTLKTEEVRRMLEIGMTERANGGELRLLPIFEYDWGSDLLRPTRHLPAALERLARRLGLTPSKIRAAYAARQKTLAKLPARATPEEVLNKLQSAAYRSG